MRCLRLLVLLALVLPTAEADQLELNVGRDLTVASIQDTGRADGRQYDASVRVTVGYGWSMSGSLGHGETDGDKAWVEEQTRLIGRESVKARVKNHTQLDGAVIAAESGDLTLDIGTLAFSDLHDKDRETSYYANISLSLSRERGDNPQQQQNNRETDQPVRSGRQAGGGGGPGGTFSGYSANHDRRQLNRATIGHGTILVRADQGSGQDSTTGLNRDIRLAQQITRDERDEINLYVSDSSVRSVAGMFQSDDPETKGNENTFGRWTDDALNYHTNTVEAINSLLRSGEYGVDVANAVGSIFAGASFSEAFQQGRSAIARRVAAWQITKYEQDAAKVLINAQNERPEDIQAAAQLLAQTMANLSGVDQKVLVSAILEDVRAASFMGATDGQTVYLDFRADKGISVSDSGMIAKVLGHEVSHIPGNNERSADYIGEVSEQSWQNELARSGLGTDTGSSAADTAWVSRNQGSVLLRTNTEAFLNTDPRKLEFYNEAGHYYATYYVAVRLDIPDDEARTLARFSQISDEIRQLDALNNQANVIRQRAIRIMGMSLPIPIPLGDPEGAEEQRDIVHQGGHALSGLEAEAVRTVVRQMILEAESPEEAGLLIHVLGDTYSHSRMVNDKEILYSTGIGHGLQGTAPDEIHRRPAQFDRYINDLVGVLGERNGNNMTKQQSEDFSIDVNSDFQGALNRATANAYRQPNPRGLPAFNDGVASDNTITEFAQLPDKYRLDQNQARSQSGQELLPPLIIDQPEKHGHNMASWGSIEEDVGSYFDQAVPLSPNPAAREQEMRDTIDALDTLPGIVFPAVRDRSRQDESGGGDGK